MFSIKPSCIKCGVCAQICPSGIIAMEQEGPKLLYPQFCNRCGHCVAVCPEGALDYEKAPLCNQIPLTSYPVLDAQTAYRFLRSRRSIRCYKKDAVPKEILLQLLDIARFAPSGSNSQGLSYMVVSGREVLKKLTDMTIDWMEEQINNHAPELQQYAGIIQAYRATQKDVVFRDAPHLIIAMAPKQHGRGRDNTRYSLAYTELFAPSLGLGTCWAGFFERYAASGCPELYRLLEMEKAMVITGAIMVGYPQYSYHRLVDRDPLKVTWR